MTQNGDIKNSKILYYFSKKNFAYFSIEENYPSIIPETSRKLLWVSDNVRNLWKTESENLMNNYINSVSNSLRSGGGISTDSDTEYTKNLEKTFRKIINDHQQEIVFVNYSIVSEEFGEI